MEVCSDLVKIYQSKQKKGKRKEREENEIHFASLVVALQKKCSEMCFGLFIIEPYLLSTYYVPDIFPDD